MPLEPADVVMVESTYGDKFHQPMSQAVTQIVEMINEADKKGGNLLIPTFALARTQDVLYQLRSAYDRRRLPRNLKVFLDSPLAIHFTKLYRHHPELLSDPVKRYIFRSQDPFGWDNVHFTLAGRESMRVQKIRKGSVILAGSGMATGGRILNHLKKNLQRPECSVSFVGFQAEGTLGRQLVEGAKIVKIDDEPFEVKAKIAKIEGFSVHADQAGIGHWVSSAGNPEVLLVHGEEETQIVLQKALSDKYNLSSKILEQGKTYEF